MSTNYDDLEKIIDDEMENEVSEVSEIGSAYEANNIIGLIKKKKEEKKEIEARAKEVVSNYKYKVDVWKENATAALDKQIEYYMSILKKYYDTYSDGTNKMKFPNGNLGYYAVREKVEWEDEAALLAFIKEQKATNPLAFSQMLKMDPKLDKEKIKSLVKFNAEGNAVYNGMVIPYINHVDKTTAINIK